MILYSTEDGVLASTFKSEEQETLTQSFLNTGSDWLKQKRGLIKPELIETENQVYSVQNLVFPGIKQSPGGILILSPASSVYQITIPVVATLLFVSFLGIFTIILKQDKINKKRLLISLAFLGFVFGSVLLSALHLINQEKTAKLKDLGQPIYNSILKLEPESGIFSKDYEYETRIKVSSGGEAVNAFKAVISFDPKIINVSDILTKDSVCSAELFIEKTIDNINGLVQVSCIIPNPGFNEPDGTLASLIIKPLKPGLYELKFEPESEVLANDGLGTNVLRTSWNSMYQIIDSPADQQSTTELLIFSSTHPNTNRWYNKKEIQLSWANLRKDYSQFSWAFNKEPDFTPPKDFQASRKSVNVLVFNDGIYYFHIAGIKNNQLGPVVHYKIMIDTVPPKPIKIKLSSPTINLGSLLRVGFETEDSASGLQSYYVRINNNAFFPAKSPLYLALDKLGNNIITIRAFDQADNLRDTEVTLQVIEKNLLKRIIQSPFQAIFTLANLSEIIF
jgi:hypothetical protein